MDYNYNQTTRRRQIQIDERKKRKLIQDMKREFEVFKKAETEML